jgi:hypothetical protein
MGLQLQLSSSAAIEAAAFHAVSKARASRTPTTCAVKNSSIIRNPIQERSGQQLTHSHLIMIAGMFQVSSSGLQRE